MAKLLAVKPLSRLLKEAENEGESGLKRTLGPLNLITLGIGAIIGAGIFVLTGQAAALHAGPAVVLSFIVAGITCAFAGLCYAEFASLIPIAGSAYTYGYATLGEFVAWIIGWDLVLEYAFGAATVASGWSGYFVGLLQDFHIHIPPQLTTTPGNVLYLYHDRWQAIMALPAGVDAATLPHVTGVFNLVAFLAIAVVTAVLVRGIQESANLNTAIVLVKLSVVGLFLVLGANFLIHHQALAHANWTPFIPPKSGARAIRLWRDHGGRGIDLLRVYRVRCGVDRRPGGEESEARYADRHSWIAGDLHGALYSGVGRADWPCELQGAGRCRSSGGRHRCDRYCLGQHPGQDWRCVRPGVGDAGDAAGPVARLLLDVAGWAAVEVGGRDSPEVPYAMDFEHRCRSDRCVYAGVAADRQAERAGEYGHAAGVCHRMRGSMDSAAA